MKLFLSVLSPFYIGSTPGRGAVMSLSGVIWYVRPSQAAACDKSSVNTILDAFITLVLIPCHVLTIQCVL